MKSGQDQNEQDLNMQYSGSYKFTKAVEFEGQTYEEVKYDLSALKSTAVIAAKSAANRLRQALGEPLMSDDLVQAVVFARSADLPAEFVLEMGAADYAAWAAIVQGFFGTALSAAIR
jgi:hypothetical protein